MSSSRSGQRVPRTGTSEAGRSRGQGPLSSTSRPSAANKGRAPPSKRMVLSRDDLRAAVIKKQLEARDAPAEKTAKKSAGESAAKEKTIAPKDTDAPVKEKRKRAPEDRFPSPPLAEPRPSSSKKAKSVEAKVEDPKVKALLRASSPSSPSMTNMKVAVDLF